MLIDIKIPSTIIKASSPFRLRWDMLIIFLAAYQAVTIPISITYEPDEFESPALKVFSSLTDIVFLIDIMINFRTTFIDDETGEEVMDLLLISTSYLFSLRFVIDVLSTIPLSDFYVGNTPFLEFLGTLKILRLSRISSFIMNLNTSSETKAAYKVFYLIFLMIMYIHFVGCMWYQITSEDEIWVPNMEFIFFGNP